MSTEETPIPSAKATSSKPVKPKDAAILSAVQSGLHPVIAVKQAGLNMSNSCAKTYVEHIKNKYADAQGGLLAALEKVGVDLDTVASTIREGLSAKRTTKSGQSIIHVADHATRHKYLETTLDVMGARAPKQHVIESHSTHEATVNIVDGIRSNPEMLLRIRERLQQRQAAEVI